MNKYNLKNMNMNKNYMNNNMKMSLINNIGMNNMNNFNNQNNMNNFNNFNNMNIMNNNNNLGQNNLVNNNYNAPKEKIIMVIFTFEKYGKQVFIDINENEKFINMIKELEEKYSWIQSLKGKKYFLNEKEIKNKDLSLKNLGIYDNSEIIIKIS